MRFLTIAVVLACSGCGGLAPGRGAVGSDSGFEVDAAGAPAVVDRRWTLDGHGQGIGVIMSAVPCGDRLFLADQHGGIRRLNLATGETESSIAPDTLAMSLAVDCTEQVVYALGPARSTFGRSRGMVLRGYDMSTGRETSDVSLGSHLMPAVAGSVVDGVFIVGGLWMPMTEGEYRHPPPGEFYRDKKIGLSVEIANGRWSAPVEPYELECRGGGRCAGGSLWPLPHGDTPDRWLASQPASSNVAFYDAEFRLTRTIDVSSPLFRHDGRSIEVADAAASVHWATTNSVVRMAMPVDAMVATVHSLAKLPKDYVFGQSAEFDWWLNLHGMDGQRLVSDIAIPGWPVGWDDRSLYAVQYGAEGRHAAPDTVAVVRIPLTSGRAGFVAP